MQLISFEYIKLYTLSAPSSAGVYRMLDIHDNVLYVGKAKNLKNRLTNYVSPAKLNARITRMVEQVAKIEVILTLSEHEAFLLEANLIKSLKPKYNILLRDDKSYPYIFIDPKKEFPQITKYRGNKKEDGLFFGPFASAGDVKKAVSEIQKIFLLRSCSDSYFKNRQRPCLEYQIKRCSAPCVQKISQEEYRNLSLAAISFLKGDRQKLLKDLTIQMNFYSDNMQYEKAAFYRDRIYALKQVLAKSVVNMPGIDDADLIAVYKEDLLSVVQMFFVRGGINYANKYYFLEHTEESSLAEILTAFAEQFYQDKPIPQQIYVSDEPENLKELSTMLNEIAGYKITIHHPKRGDKLKMMEFVLENAKNALKNKLRTQNKYGLLLQEVTKLFGLDKEINKIYAFDNSHISGTNAVGAMICLDQTGFVKKEYKIFKIKNNSSTGGDDYAMLNEVLTRQLKYVNQNDNIFWLIDGGKGHMHIVEKVFEQNAKRIDYACIAKGIDRNSGKEVFHSPYNEAFTLDKDIEIMKFLQIIRDEVHRFAITSHRKQRSINIKKSTLTNIPNIGPKRAAMLLQNFASLNEIIDSDNKVLTNMLKINNSSIEEIKFYIKSLIAKTC